jgi:outer membrane usher protein
MAPLEGVCAPRNHERENGISMATSHCHPYAMRDTVAGNETNTRLALSVIAALGLVPTWSFAASVAPTNADWGAGAVEFNNVLAVGNHHVDVSRYEHGNPVMPGNYELDVYLNEIRISSSNVTFKANGDEEAKPCFSYIDLVQWGVDVAKLDAAVVNASNTCIGISDISPDGRASADIGDLRLNLSIPQASLLRRGRGYVSPELWNQGETAFLLSYNFNVYASDQAIRESAVPFGQALDNSGIYTPVQSNAYYSPRPDGTYVPDPKGAYAIGLNGNYVPVRNGSYVAPTDRNYNQSNTSAYLGLNTGFNWDGWRLRSQETATWNKVTSRAEWNNINTTVSHDVDWYKGQVTFGDSYTQGLVFDTTPFRGMTIYSDDRMLPDSMQGFAPTVRGVANTQARVEISQNKNIIYETTVAPGQFVINDLYATGYGGDLVVTVFEADGSTHSFVVPYSAVPMALRPGVSRWALTNGQFRDTSLIHAMPYYLEATYQRGITNQITIYGGLQTTYRALYKAYLGGVAANTPIGAFGFDVTNSRTNLRNSSSRSGYSARLSYAKTIPSSGTTFAVATYRYSNDRFYTLQQAVTAQDRIGPGKAIVDYVAPLLQNKQRAQVNLSQDFGARYGQLYFTGTYSNYWNVNSSAATYQFGYNNHYKRLNFGVTASRTVSSTPVFRGSRYDNQYGVSLSLPLGTDLSHAPMFSVGLAHDDVSGNMDSATVSGVLGDRNQYNYSASAQYNENATSDQSSKLVSGAAGWQAAYGNLNAGYSQGSNYQQRSMGGSGGLIIHQGGVTLSPTLDIYGGSVAVVEAPDAKGARVTGVGGQSTVNGGGYVVATGLMPYRMNEVGLDPKGTSMDVELENTSQQVSPRVGAVIPVKFATKSGLAMLIRASRSNGEALPFGADVFDANGNDLGVVGQGGQLLIRSTNEGGTLTVRWGENAQQQCEVTYEAPLRAKGDKVDGLITVDAICR